MKRTTDQNHVVELQDAAITALTAGRDEAARATFAEATRLACEVLPPTDPVRLGAAGAHAEAWFERWNDVEKALEIAREAYDEAVFAIDDAPGGQYQDTVRQLSALRDQMTFWAFRMTSSE
jgi:14-3-3 protein